MARRRDLSILTTVALLAAWSCTVHKQETPDLAGPSEAGLSITVAITPDILSQDGASQSQVTITARDSNGQPARNVSLRAEISVGGLLADFGTLSARNIVTDANGRATLVYTAPPAPAIAVDTGTVVDIQVTPTGSDFGNSKPKSASVRLVPPNIVIPPDGLKPSFTINPPAPIDHQPVIFDASASEPKTGQNAIVSYAWDFGDGDHATGITAQHSFDDAGSFIVTLTVTDTFGRQARLPQAVNVSQGQAPNATFNTSPANPLPSQQVFFNASASRAAAGRTITSYAWDFGDGTSGSGVQTTHTYTTTGTYTVTLTVTDDANHVGTFSQGVTVGSDTPTADFTSSPTSPTAGTIVNFNGTASKAVAGRTIVSYTWSFGDGFTGSGATTAHTFTAPGSYVVTLTVVDSAGKSNSVSKTVTVS